MCLLLWSVHGSITDWLEVRHITNRIWNCTGKPHEGWVWPVQAQRGNTRTHHDNYGGDARTHQVERFNERVVRWAWLTSLTYCDSLLRILPGPTSSVLPLAETCPCGRLTATLLFSFPPVVALEGADRSGSKRTAESNQVCDLSPHNVTLI